MANYIYTVIDMVYIKVILEDDVKMIDELTVQPTTPNQEGISVIFEKDNATVVYKKNNIEEASESRNSVVPVSYEEMLKGSKALQAGTPWLYEDKTHSLQIFPIGNTNYRMNISSPGTFGTKNYGIPLRIAHSALNIMKEYAKRAVLEDNTVVM